MLLVQGVTRDLLYGADVDRNGVQNGAEQAATTSTMPPASGFDRGWSAFFTIHSREQNCDLNGNPYLYINNTDLQQLYNKISLDVDDKLAKFVVMYLQYGPASSTGSTQGLVSTVKALGNAGGNTSTSNNIVQGTLANYQVQYNKKASNNITSFFQLVNAKVNVQSTDPQTKKTITTQYTSPFYNNVGNQRSFLPLLFTYFTKDDPTKLPDIPARININTAPQEILNSLQNVGGSARLKQRLQRGNNVSQRHQHNGPGRVRCAERDSDAATGNRAARRYLRHADLAVDRGEHQAGSVAGAGTLHHDARRFSACNRSATSTAAKARRPASKPSLTPTAAVRASSPGATCRTSARAGTTRTPRIVGTAQA